MNSLWSFMNSLKVSLNFWVIFSIVWIYINKRIFVNKVTKMNIKQINIIIISESIIRLKWICQFQTENFPVLYRTINSILFFIAVRSESCFLFNESWKCKTKIPVKIFKHQLNILRKNKTKLSINLL